MSRKVRRPNAGRPARVQAEFNVPDKDTKSRRAGVRAPIGAKKPGNCRWSEGAQEGGDVKFTGGGRTPGARLPRYLSVRAQRPRSDRTHTSTLARTVAEGMTRLLATLTARDGPRRHPLGHRAEAVGLGHDPCLSRQSSLR